jgi:hypothetical protein
LIKSYKRASMEKDEPKAKVMSATDVWEDAREIASLIKKNLMKAEPVVKIQIPLSTFISAVENLSREELLILSKRIEARLAV